MKRNALALGFAALLTVGSLVAPMQSHAAAKLPGTCDLVKNTYCSPASLLDTLLALFCFEPPTR